MLRVSENVLLGRGEKQDIYFYCLFFWNAEIAIVTDTKTLKGHEDLKKKAISKSLYRIVQSVLTD